MTEEKKVAKKAPKKVTPKKEDHKESVAEPIIKKEAVKPTKRTFDKYDDVEIMNNTTGRYGYNSKSGFALEMEEYGDTLTIPFGELKTMRSNQKRHIAFIQVKV